MTPVNAGDTGTPSDSGFCMIAGMDSFRVSSISGGSDSAVGGSTGGLVGGSGTSSGLGSRIA